MLNASLAVGLIILQPQLAVCTTALKRMIKTKERNFFSFSSYKQTCKYWLIYKPTKSVKMRNQYINNT